RGTFSFQPNAGFDAQMHLAGVQEDVDHRLLLNAAIQDVGPRFAQEMRDAGISVPTISLLMSMRIHGVTGAFARDMRLMYPQVSAEQLVTMQIHGVTMQFARDIRQMYPSVTR